MLIQNVAKCKRVPKCPCCLQFDSLVVKIILRSNGAREYNSSLYVRKNIVGGALIVYTVLRLVEIDWNRRLPSLIIGSK